MKKNEESEQYYENETPQPLLKLAPEWVNSAQAFEIVSLRLVVTSK